MNRISDDLRAALRQFALAPQLTLAEGTVHLGTFLTPEVLSNE